MIRLKRGVFRPTESRTVVSGTVGISAEMFKSPSNNLKTVWFQPSILRSAEARRNAETIKRGKTKQKVSRY